MLKTQIGRIRYSFKLSLNILGFERFQTTPIMQARGVPQNVEQMEEQMDAVSDLFRLIQTSCIAKCDNTNRAPASYLTVGEGLCLDRVCVHIDGLYRV